MRIAIVLCFMLILCGCGISVIPSPLPDSSSRIVGDVISSNSDGIEFSAKIVDVEMPPYQASANIASFYVVIKNSSGSDITIPLSTLNIVDSSGRQYSPLDPTSVRDSLEKRSNYFLPYPFVGFYYLQDQMGYAVDQSFSPTYNLSEHHSRNILLDALSVGIVRDNSQISGMVYFNIDLYKITFFTLNLNIKDLYSNKSNISFPFEVKN